jgi:hypothetical protein
MGHWTVDGGKNVRLFFDEMAKKRNLDPFVPELQVIGFLSQIDNSFSIIS